MELPVERWFPAIALRTSRRAYETQALAEHALARLEQVCREFRPFPEARTVLVREPAAGVFKGIIGNYGRVTGAPCYLAFVGDMDSARVQECTGYTGEGLVLEATTLGLGTCWVGGFFGRAAVSAQVRLRASERVLAISPVGYPRAKGGFTDASFKFIAGSRKREPLAKIVRGSPPLNEVLLAGLEAARLAPSARNRQPWRFVICEGNILVRTDKARRRDRISRRLDCGIAMLHLELGLWASGLRGSWEFLRPPDVARFKFRSA
jgi:nitroreductase